MINSEIIRATKRLFGKDRRALKNLLLSYNFDGSDTRHLEKIFKHATKQPISLNYGINDNVVDDIRSDKKLNMFWLGDLSWSCMILLNTNINKGYDWDKKLCNACNGTAKICEFSISDTLPVYTYDLYYMTYDNKGNWYEFGPINKLNTFEKNVVQSVSNSLNDSGRTHIGKAFAKKKFKDLYTDTNKDGGATIYDCLFSDIYPYQEEYLRFLENTVEDKTHNCSTTWKEYFVKPGILREREEWRYYKSKNSICIITNDKNEITEIKVYRDAGRFKHREFKYNVDNKVKEIVMKEKMARPVPRKRP